MPELWYRCLYRFLTRVYFARLAMVNPERRPKSGQPVLYLGLHRNGAVDGFVYHELLRRPVFMISTQLRRSWFSRLFFQGIAVTRTKDEGGQEANQGALRQCVDHLSGGGHLFVFPEGTSSLGPRHLPFKSGAAWLVLDYLESGGPLLQIVPVGIHYECPWAFRAKVEVVLGPPMSLQFAPGASRLARLKEIKRRIEGALEEVGTNVASAEYQDQIQRLAYITTLATPRSYFKSLKALEQRIPEAILKAADGLEPELSRSRLLSHQGVPLFPMGPLWLYGVALAVFGPLVLAAFLLNLPPVLAGWLAGKKFPDDSNVISLWKILVGVPAFALWGAAVVLALLVEQRPLGAVLYVLLTWLGLELYYRVKKLAVAVWNGSRYPKLKPRMLAFRQTVLEALPE